MIIAGFQKLTLLDYPGHLAAIVFTQGCNFYCGYCHNPEMIPRVSSGPKRSDLQAETVLDFLKKRKDLLDGVVISGGEPTLQEDLQDFIKAIKTMGFLVKLDTNGSNPEVLQELINQQLLDYIAMDVKHSKKKYRDLVKSDVAKSIQKSITIIMNSNVDYEFRSTLVPSYHSEEDVDSMGKMIRGAKQWYLQPFRPLKTLDKRLARERSYTSEELDRFKNIASRFAKMVEVRI